MSKDVIERCCRNAGLSPEKRTVIEGYDLFIADGFVPPDKIVPYFWRFGLNDTDVKDLFPYGMWVAVWWLAQGEDNVDMGQPLFFKSFHDPSLGSMEARKQARINTAIQECKGFLERRRKVRENG